MFQNSKGGPLARLWDKVQRDQTVVEEPPWSGSNYFVGIVAEEPGYAHTSEKGYLMNQIRLVCPSCALMDEDFSPIGIAMVVSVAGANESSNKITPEFIGRWFIP